MAEKQETVTDLIAWLRSPTEGENAYLTMWRDEIADRLEAAHKREMSKNVSKNGADFGQLGDCAKMRNALKRIVAASIVAKNANAPEWILQRMADIFAMATTALAEPPRNCDRYASAEEAWDAYDKWVESYRTKGEIPPYNEFGWLFAPATERKGENDGK